MDILQLQEMGAFVPTKLFKRALKVDVPEQAPADTWEDPEVPEFTDQTKESKVDIYIKRLEKLEEIAESFEGVDKSYAIQAGREVRIIVKPEAIDDAESVRVAREISKRIESELDYPGQIKVTVIRETRAVEYAK